MRHLDRLLTRHTDNPATHCMKLQKFDANIATADSCFVLIGPCQCSAALGGPATSTEDLRHQGALNKPGVLKHLWACMAIKCSNITPHTHAGFTGSPDIASGQASDVGCRMRHTDRQLPSYTLHAWLLNAQQKLKVHSSHT